MKLALFDLDNTLLAGDSDYSWGRFLVDEGMVDGASYEAQNKKFFEDYKAGQLDIYEFIRFSLGRLGEFSMSELEALRSRFIETVVKSMVAPGTAQLLQSHRDAGHELIIITATNSFVTTPIAELLGVPHLLGTDGEIQDGRFTGEILGTPCFQAGKVTRLEQWLAAQGAVEESWFYSDSINDAPLLRWATHPYAVDPCPKLKALAEAEGWPIMSLRGAPI